MAFLKILILLLKAFIFILTFIDVNDSAKILIVLPHYGKSHHIFYSSFVEELALRGHEVVVINNFRLKNITNLRQILLPKADDINNVVNVEEFHKDAPKALSDLIYAYRTAKAFKRMAYENCRRLFKSKDVLDFMNSKEKFDVAVVEQFVTDCGLAVADRIKVPTVAMAAHVLLPWMYPRLGIENNPAFVPNHFTGDEILPSIWSRCKNVSELEVLANNVSLIMLNQYFPLTGSRIYGANVVEIGGIHVKTFGISDQVLQKFLDSATKGVVYISFGSIASNLPSQKINEIMKVVRNSDMRFVWKVETIGNVTTPNNLLVRKWLPQIDILCHSNVFAFVSHSGMLSSSEAVHCGVPVVSIPLFGDQFANAASARNAALGVTIDFEDLDERTLKNALNTVLQIRFRNRVKQISALWNDRPVSAMDTAVYWVEYIAKYGALSQLRPASIGVPLYQKLLIDVWVTVGCLFLGLYYMMVKSVTVCKKYQKKIEK